ncbi:hypothetical protein MLD38_035860 [Melastoma candidum]|uniref:Uncharacterized protein n=1 Tax=Melastoma candidum TaxID=119954 RepID=A0ACB9LHE7_9MYRT|nr:hypothetical protein MLD38_035860 [Melastoma candidum]
MGELIGTESDGIESVRIELSEIGRSLRSSFRRHASGLRSSFRSVSSSSVRDDANDEENVLLWAEIERLPTFERLRSSLFEDSDANNADHRPKKVVDLSKLTLTDRHLFIEKLIQHIEHDNLKLLRNIRKRTDRVGVQMPTIEVRYNNLCIEGECEIVHGKPLPTLWNSLKGMLPNIPIPGSKLRKAKITILNDVSGVIKPGRLTLLLGPPGCGKTSFLKALSGTLNKSLKVSGEILYNGHRLNEFVPQKTAAYISQADLQISEMTVRETLDFSACCLGVGNRADMLIEVSRREKEAGIFPDPDIDAYMKAISLKGLKRTLQTDYILKILGLDICADTLVGDAMRRGISGGQKKRVTTGEMIVGPNKALFMDEITNGLDSSTAFQVVSCLQQLAHLTDATVLISLLQPAPETFDLFDELILMAEGKIVYQGPRDQAVQFFEDCGFKCPERKGVADFLQEVISRKDQGQYWRYSDQPFKHVSVDMFCRSFKETLIGRNINQQLSDPFDRSKSDKTALCHDVYSLSKWELLKACMAREILLMKRNSFIYIFKTTQLFVTACITTTVFLRTQMGIDLTHANDYMGSLFYSLIILLVDGMPELTMTVARLAVFYKQRDLYFYPAWAYAIPASILKIPISLLESFVWTAITYYGIGYSPEPSRFFRQFLLFFAVHWSSISMFRFVASIFRTVVASNTAGSFSILIVFMCGGFAIPRLSMPVWLKWSFWVSPVSYGQIGVSVNEFLAPRWQKVQSANQTIGHATLEARGLNFDGYFFWISFGALIGFTFLFNLGYTLALTFLKPAQSSVFISHEKFVQSQQKESSHGGNIEQHHKEDSSEPMELKSSQMVLPFTPLTLAFKDVQYFIDTPLEMIEHGFAQKKLQLLSNVTGAFRPGVLTALMGVSGAGKTTLMDVLSGRKTTGHVEGEIKIGGYDKVQETFARISGYCEQFDTHSPQITVEESLIFSAWLRLDPQIEPKTKVAFVNQVLETIELDKIKDSLVGIPGVSGLSTEQRKRLTIAVELVANPSIIFMDEPTTGLDARAAAIVMRTVKNIVDTGRTIVCTIHQPSIDIFESFDELVLLKNGGKLIYSGPLGQHSCKVIEHFQKIPGVPNIKSNYNPATWMLEVTSPSAEAENGVDFAKIYQDSDLYKTNQELVKRLSVPPPNSSDLHFHTRYPQSGWGQFKSCLWKQYLSYWRSPTYNLMRTLHTVAASLVFGVLFWNQGKKLDSQQSIFSVFGVLYISVIFLGVNNCSSVLSYISYERTVMYRERFAGMYSTLAFSLAQVTVEIPYIFLQASLFLIITYPMIGFYASAYKIFWYFYAMFCIFLSFNYLGMLLVSVTPNMMVAAILSSAFYTMLNLFAGFLMPRPQFPKWWIWVYYLCPTSWALNGLLTSQYGDIERTITVFGTKKSVAEFLRDYFGFRHDHLYATGIVLAAFPLVQALLFAYTIGRFNFQKR